MSKSTITLVAVDPGNQAVIVLAVLRHDQRLADMAGGNNVSASTVRRWLQEVVELLAARAPRLDRALKKIVRIGGVVVLLDGTLVRTRRRTGTDNRKNYSGKHKAHGLLFLALTDDKGNLIWISAASPAAPARPPPPATTRSPDTCGRPGSQPWPTSASSASMTSPTTSR
ncbi:hypothetical protein [Streptomyces sp. UG1]|uniref:hypothetical protein n=1 Tax=Streptomyces sp. UG1 TaxID=3417652 RepID=UPI003CF0A60B